MYFSILRGLQRGLDWQRLYCVGCVIQLLVEVLFYETSECVIVNFFIPNLARTEVQGVTFAIYQAIQSICSSNSQSSVPILDAPRYLFLSTRLAEKFPNLLESVIVRSYHSYSPGELSRKWRISHSSTSNSLLNWNSRSGVGSRVRRVTFTSFVISCLQYIGSASISTQRFFIHAIQPLLTAALAYFSSLIYNNPLYLLILAPFLGYLCHEIWKRWYLEEKSVEDVIVPMIETKETGDINIKENKENTTPKETINSKQNLRSELDFNNNNSNNNQIKNKNINDNNYENEKEDLSTGSLNLPNSNKNNLNKINKLQNSKNSNDSNDFELQSQSMSESIHSPEFQDSGFDENISRRYSNGSFKYESNDDENESDDDILNQSFSDDFLSFDDSFHDIDIDSSSNQYDKQYQGSISSGDINFELNYHFETNSLDEDQ